MIYGLRGLRIQGLRVAGRKISGGSGVRGIGLLGFQADGGEYFEVHGYESLGWLSKL